MFPSFFLINYRSVELAVCRLGLSPISESTCPAFPVGVKTRNLVFYLYQLPHYISSIEITGFTDLFFTGPSETLKEN